MIIDKPAALLPNLGYPSSLVRASVNESVLDEFRVGGPAALWRNPIDAAVSRYVFALRTQHEYRRRMQLLHKKYFMMSYQPDGHIYIRNRHLNVNMDDLLKLGLSEPHRFYPLSALFPEPEGQPLVASLEALAWRARRVLPKHLKYAGHEFIMRFMTAVQRSFDTGHMDHEPTLGKAYADPGTWAAPHKAFDPRGVIHGIQHFKNPDRSQIIVARAGDETIFNLPHGEGVFEAALHPEIKGIDLRFWTGVMTAPLGPR